MRDCGCNKGAAWFVQKANDICRMHTLFTLEDLYGLTVSKSDGEICLKVDTSKGKDRSRTPENAVCLERAD